MEQTYENYSIKRLVAICIDNDILVPPEVLDDKQALINLIRQKSPSQQNTVRIIKNYTKEAKKWVMQDFVRHYTQRFKTIGNILKRRQGLEHSISISRISTKSEREAVSLIGLVYEMRETKGGHTVLVMEDRTGTVEVWIHASNKKLKKQAKDIVLDEVLGISGKTVGRGRLFADNIYFPDVPLNKELKKGTKEKYVVFVGDVEIGAKLFMKEEFEHFIFWLSGKLGTQEQREIAKKVGYVVFIGDLVHGAGIYPGQQDDQNISDIQEQYKEFTKYVKMIPSHIQIVMIPGNHDAGRLQEPQLPLYKDFAAELYEMPNVHVLSNPCTFNIDATATHPGFDILAYHGYSLIYYADQVPSIREAGGQKASDKIMQLYLQKRHLAPTHKSNTYIPDPEEDPMIIETVPDILVTGHIHRISYGMYNNVTMINCGCWNDASEEQAKRGLEPQPAKLPMINLRTRELKIMNFGGAE